MKAKHLRVLSWFKIMLWSVNMYLEDTMNVVTIADIVGVHRSTVYNWINRYKEGGEKSLEYKSRRPHMIHRISPETLEKIIDLYREGYGCLRIGYELQIGHMTVWRYLVKLGVLKKDRTVRKKWKSFQRKYANSLWQMDLTCIDSEKNVWAFVVIDDHSRFVPVFKVIYGNPTIEDIIPALNEAFLKYGTPRQILTDRGTQFHSVRSGVSTFDMWLHELCVKHILASRKHPQTNGKVERVIRTFKEECLMKENWTVETVQNVIDCYKDYYNFHRLHMAFEYYKCYGREIQKRIFFVPYLRFATHGR
ncbi:MAG: integrase core domain-containing protein [Thermoplasmata archaeon]